MASLLHIGLDEVAEQVKQVSSGKELSEYYLSFATDLNWLYLKSKYWYTLGWWAQPQHPTPTPIPIPISMVGILNRPHHSSGLSTSKKNPENANNNKKCQRCQKIQKGKYLWGKLPSLKSLWYFSYFCTKFATCTYFSHQDNCIYENEKVKVCQGKLTIVIKW